MIQDMEKQEKTKKQKLTKEEKIKQLKDKEKQIKARIAKLQAVDKVKARKADARKKILLGGFVLSLIEKDQAAKQLYDKFIVSVERNSDKDLFK